MPYDLRPLTQPPTAFAVAYRRDPLLAISGLADLGGDGAVVPDLRGRKLLFANHPDLVAEVLIRKADAFVKARGLQIASYVLGKGLITGEEPHHGRMRKLVLPAFHHTRLRTYGDVMVRRTVEAAAPWAAGTAFDLRRAMMALTLKITVETLFGTEAEGDVEAIYRAMEAGLHVFDHTNNPVALRGGDGLRYSRRALDAVVYKFIDRRRAHPGDTGDLLSMLLSAQEEGTRLGLTDEEVRDEAVSLLISGHETSAVALTCTLWALAGRPEAQDRLQAEADAVLGVRRATFDDLPRLPYARQVFSEGMRLYPPVWILARESTRDVTIGGVALAPKHTVVLSPYTLHRSARWWDRPEAFRPERFTAEAKRARPKFAYLPFGVGQRRCIGEPFVWAEGTLVLATLAQRFRFHRAMPELRLFAGLTLRPDGEVLVEVEPRARGAARKGGAPVASTAPTA